MARVRPRHVALAAFALFTLVFPWLVLQVLAIFLAPIVAFVIYLACVGVDGFWRRVRGSYLRIKARNPRVAERLQHAFLTGTAAWDGALDRLPIKVPEALYVPNFDAMAAEEAAHQHALDLRFAKLSEETGRDRW